VSDVLYTYVPEFEAEFAKVLGEREEILDSLSRVRPGLLRRGLARLGIGSPYTKAAAELDLRAAQQATMNLSNATRQLADFIASHFDPSDMTVRS
jgi:hypothetical protein